MAGLDNVFAEPTRRDLLRRGLACGVAGALCRVDRSLAQDVASTGALEGPRLKGLAPSPSTTVCS